MINTREIYEKYYSAVAGRYYTPKEKSRLLALFAEANGISEEKAEFKRIMETVEAVENLGIETIVDCKNFLLIADAIPGKRELIKAVKAAKVCLEKYEESGGRTYSDVIDWRTAVYKNAETDAGYKLDAAYIEYARGSLDKATERFEQLADERAHLPSVEYLSVIYRKQGNGSDALFWMVVLSEVLEGVLSMDCPEVLMKNIEQAKSGLDTEQIDKIIENAKKKVKLKFGYGKITRGSIGFQPRN